MNPKVDVFFLDGCGRCSLGGTPSCKVHLWDEALALLRRIVLDCGLDEELKWGQPVYMYNGHNMMMIAAFKDNCVLSFFKGALMADPDKILTLPGANSQASRVIRFTNLDQVISLQSTLTSYVNEAIEVEKSGKKVELRDNTKLDLPEELLAIFDEDPAFENAFRALTPGRQRGYVIFFSGAKQSATKISRIEKSMDRIFNGKGMQD